MSKEISPEIKAERERIKKILEEKLKKFEKIAKFSKTGKSKKKKRDRHICISKIKQGFENMLFWIDTPDYVKAKDRTLKDKAL